MRAMEKREREREKKSRIVVAGFVVNELSQRLTSKRRKTSDKARFVEGVCVGVWRFLLFFFFIALSKQRKTPEKK